MFELRCSCPEDTLYEDAQRQSPSPLKPEDMQPPPSKPQEPVDLDPAPEPEATEVQPPAERPQQELSKGAIEKRLWRVFQLRSDGSHVLSDDFVKQ